MTNRRDSLRQRAASWDRLTLLALAASLCLAIWAIAKFGGFDLMTRVVDPSGQSFNVPNAFATVDHPFHAARADALLSSLRDMRPLRWFGGHEGGYPIEFYPVGVAWIDVLLWALTLGAFPIVAVHKLTVLLVFVLPVAGFWILARGDRLNPFVPVLALAIQLACPGLWTSGGLIELVEWGLVANVGGATLAFIGIAALARYIDEGKRYLALVAIASLAAAMYANSRASIPIAVGALAIVLAMLARHLPWLRQVDSPGIRVAAGRLALVGIVSGLLAAPLLFAMLRYQDLYFFVNYNEYANAGEYWQATLDAVSTPVTWLAMVGVVVSFAVPALRPMRAIAITLVLYALLTLALSGNALNEGIIQQLETPRLMPFQRLLVIYLAAAVIGWVLGQATRLTPRLGHWLAAAALVGASVYTLSTYPGDFGRVPEDLVTSPRPTAGVLETAQFQEIVELADAAVEPGHAIYVVGDQESWWHEQLWATTYSEAPFFYDDWMWYWQEEVIEPCNPNGEHFHPVAADTINQQFFRDRGISHVVITNRQDPCDSIDPRHEAADNPDLTLLETVGYWDLYAVDSPGAIVTNGDRQPVSASFENGHIEATFEGAGGTVTVRHNWFPRWEAWADGKRVHVTKTEDGFMQLEVPDGTRHIELRYTVTALDWIGRFAAISGAAILVVIAVGGVERFRRPAPAVDPAPVTG
jgi:hypothetical protein